MCVQTRCNLLSSLALAETFVFLDLDVQVVRVCVVCVAACVVCGCVVYE